LPVAVVVVPVTLLLKMAQVPVVVVRSQSLPTLRLPPTRRSTSALVLAALVVRLVLRLALQPVVILGSIRPQMPHQLRRLTVP
jgi:hypothetical protein